MDECPNYFFDCSCLLCQWDWWYWHEESYVDEAGCEYCDDEPPDKPDPRKDAS